MIKIRNVGDLKALLREKCPIISNNNPKKRGDNDLNHYKRDSALIVYDLLCCADRTTRDEIINDIIEAKSRFEVGEILNKAYKLI